MSFAADCVFWVTQIVCVHCKCCSTYESTDPDECLICDRLVIDEVRLSILRLIRIVDIESPSVRLSFKICTKPGGELAMKLTLTIVSLLAMLLGAWWVAQGTGLAPIGFMANNMDWAYRGAGLFVVGFLALIFARRQ